MGFFPAINFLSFCSSVCEYPKVILLKLDLRARALIDPIPNNPCFHSQVLRVSAFDADDRDNGKVSYELSADGTGTSSLDSAFVIDRISGDIRSNVSLDREARGAYEFKVRGRIKIESKNKLVSPTAGNGNFS